MKIQTNVVKRGSVYYYRARYPSDLVAHFGKVEFSFSLHTKNIREANSKANVHQLRYDQEFSHIRAMLSSTSDITETELERIALLWSSKLIAESRRNLIDINSIADTTQISNTVKSELVSHGINLRQDNPLFLKACEYFVTASRQAFEEMELQSSKTNKVERIPVKAKSDDSMQHLIKYWQSQGSKTPRTIQEATTVVNRFSSMIENKPASKITKSDVVQFKDMLLTEGNEPATAIKKINLLKAIFQTALDNDKLSINPATGVKVPKEDKNTKSRIPFSKDELETIFNSSIYTHGERPRAGAGEAAFWIPLLALWTGARLEELGQLHVADIQEEAGIKYIHITNDGGDKNVKTSSSKRKIPIHPQLLKIGFMEYVNSIKQAGHTRLFPLIKSPEGRQKTAMFSKWFGRHLRETLKIEDTRKVFHSFRHGFKDACRLSGVLSEHHDRLTGHSNGSIGDSYGGEYYPLKPLNEAMNIGIDVTPIAYNGVL